MYVCLCEKYLPSFTFLHLITRDIKFLTLTVVTVHCLTERRNSIIRKPCIIWNNSITLSWYNTDHEAGPSVWHQGNQSIPSWTGFHWENASRQCYTCKIKLLTYFLQLRTGSPEGTSSLFIQTGRPPLLQLVLNGVPGVLETNSSSSVPPNRSPTHCTSDGLWTNECTVPVSTYFIALSHVIV